MTIHGFRGNIKENNLKNSTLNMLKIQPYIDAIALKGGKVLLKSRRRENLKSCSVRGLIAASGRRWL
ncbi:MAG: hypothetical protein KAT65_30705 [Methanophagales archaeon]|nr:hypothetical protein [Methanophagales archaeon]